jgi:hypothetical protein
MAEHGERRIQQAAFRSVATGEVVATGACHDLSCLPGGLDADLDAWEAGFTDGAGCFLTRREAGSAVGVRGRLESRAYFAGDPCPTLEAGHREAWIRARDGEDPQPVLPWTPLTGT